eukprot:GEMP01007017.1.p1 GENE.GEMP01007017.1~~GEMP01007017.1.p1  ORF type:complete len:736 (+),score=167.67 GEMP01007017.1:188-2395(+)
MTEPMKIEETDNAVPEAPTPVATATIAATEATAATSATSAATVATAVVEDAREVKEEQPVGEVIVNEDEPEEGADWSDNNEEAEEEGAKVPSPLAAEEDAPEEAPGTVMVSLSDDEDDKTIEDKADTKEKSTEYPDSTDDIDYKRCNRIELCGDDSTAHAFLGPNKRSLSSLCCDGFQYLFCASRTNYGFVGGRYCFELQWIEKARSSGIVRIGLSSVEPGKFCPGADNCVMFTSDGKIYGDETTASSSTSSSFDRTSLISVVFDLEDIDAASISLFLNGKRSSSMVDLPESMKNAIRKGDGVFPTIVSRSSSVTFNFGPKPLANLPFKARMISQADEAHAVPNPIAKEPAEALFVLQFHEDEQNYMAPDGYFEISDKSLARWGVESENDLGDRGFTVKALNDRETLLKQFLHLAAGSKRKICVVANILAPGRRRELRSIFSMFRCKLVVRLIEHGLNGRPPKHYLSYCLPGVDEFDEITYDTSREDAARILDEYIEANKLHEKLEPDIPATFRDQLEDCRMQVLLWKKTQRGLDVPEPDDEDRDTMNVDIDTGGQDGLPIFAYFTDADWSLFDLRFDLVLMMQAFVTETKRQGFHSKNLDHYYSLYFKRSLKLSAYGCADLQEMIETLVPDLLLTGSLLHLSPDSEQPVTSHHLLRLVEVERRDRRYRVDAGDETAKLKFSAARIAESRTSERRELRDRDQKKRARSRSRGSRHVGRRSRSAKRTKGSRSNNHR